MRLLQLAVAVFLALVLAAQWLWPGGVPEPGTPVASGNGAGDGTADPVQGEPPELPPLSFYSEVGERPLFFEGRRPPPDQPDEGEVAEEPEAEPDAPPPKVALTGILILEGERYALVKRADGKGTERLRVGDEYESWTVDEIGEERLVMANNGQKEEFLLWQYKAVLPPSQAKKAPARPTSAARPSFRRPTFGANRRPARTSSSGAD